MSRLKAIKPWRDAMLFVIACEGEETEIEYFEGLGEKFQNNPRIRIEIVEREKNSKSKSAPEYVIQTLDKRKKSITLQKTKVEFWAIIDFDSWGVEKLAQIATLSKQKNYNLAVSNPCFEIWYLLHFTKITTDICKEISDEKSAGKPKGKLNINIVKFKKELFDSGNAFNGYFPRIETAIKNAKMTKPEECKCKLRLKDNDYYYGSDVYKLAERLIIK